MVTFHAIGRFELSIMVDNSWTIAISEHCLFDMFAFQPSSLHISKDVSYDYINFVSSSLYQIPMTSLQGRQWVVGCGHCRIVDDSLAHNYQETSLITRTTGSVVKTMKKYFKIDNIFLQCFDSLVSFTFIKLFDSSMGEDLTPLPLSTKLSKHIIQFKAFLLLEPSTHVESI
jgi:hypothetical protein